MTVEGGNVVGTVVSAVLMSWLAYKFGRAHEKTNHEKEKSKTEAHIRFVRGRLDNDDVVRRLHDTFKR